MKKYLVYFLANTIAFYASIVLFNTAQSNPVEISAFAGLVLTLVNIFIRPLLMLVALPVNLLTLGLFILIINTWMVMLTDKLVPALHMRVLGSFLTAVDLYRKLFRKTLISENDVLRCDISTLPCNNSHKKISLAKRDSIAALSHPTYFLLSLRNSCKIP